VNDTVTSVLGEYRGPGRFHNGTDIAGPGHDDGSQIYSVFSGYCQPRGTNEVRITDEVEPGSRQSGSYVHARPSCEPEDKIQGLSTETHNHPATQIATVVGHHLHYIFGPGVGAGTEGGSNNALLPGGLDGYIDLAPPTVVAGSLRFCEDVVDSDALPEIDCEGGFVVDGQQTTIWGAVDARIRAMDTYTNPDGSSGGGRTGVYMLGYRITDPTSGAVVLEDLDSVVFDVNPDASGLRLIIPVAPSVGQAIEYWVTNVKRSGADRVLDSRWRTRRTCEGCPDAAANSLAEFKDGRYQFAACVRDVNPANQACEERQIILDNFKPRIVDFVVTGTGQGVDQSAKIGDQVDVAIRFDQEMDPARMPEISLVDIHTRVQGQIENGAWSTVVRTNRTISEFRGRLKMPEMYRQENRSLLLEVSHAKGLGPEDRDIMRPETTLDDSLTPLVVYADLVRPRPSASAIDPVVECGALEIAVNATDEPGNYEPGQPIPNMNRFSGISLRIDIKGLTGEWTLFRGQTIAGPEDRVEIRGFEGDTLYRWYLEVEDAAGNLDEVSFREKDGERQTANEFFVRACRQTPEDTLACREVECRSVERECRRTPTCPPPHQSICTRYYCEQGRCITEKSSCDPRPERRDDYYNQSGSWSDDNVDLADLVPTMKNVTNLRADAEVAVLGSGVTSAMFGLLAEFGEEARLVDVRLPPAELVGVKVLLVPSGGLRNQEPQGLREGLRAFAESGGQVVVLAQPFGEDFAAAPGPVTGYGWQESVMCSVGNLYFEEDYGEHPALSSVGRNSAGRGVMSLPVDGHFIGWPENADVWLRRVMNNRAALVRYSVGAGSVTVAAAFLDHDRVRRYRLRASEAVNGGKLRAEEKFFRDLVTWLKAPGEMPRMIHGQASVSLALRLVNDAPGGEQAARARLRVLDPSRTYAMWESDVELSLGPGEEIELPVDVPFDWARFNRGEAGSGYHLPVGIWHTHVELMDDGGSVIRLDREEPSGRFAVPAETGQGAWFDPRDVSLGILVEHSSMPAGMEGVCRFEIGNEGDEPRRLRFKLNTRHAPYSPLLDVTAEVAAGETWIQEYSTGTRTSGEFQILARVWDADTGELLASGRKSLWFLDIPLAMSGYATPEYPGAGGEVEVAVGYRNLTDVELTGELGIEAKGLEGSLTQAFTLGPNEVGLGTTTVVVPGGALPGTTYLAQAKAVDPGGRLLGHLYKTISVNAPGVDPYITIRTDKKVYLRGDEIRVMVHVRNIGEGDELPYHLQVGSLWAGEGVIAFDDDSQAMITQVVTVPEELEASGTQVIRFESWRGNATSTVEIGGPYLSILPEFEASTTSVEVTGVLRLLGGPDMDATVTCRLVGPGGGLEAEQILLPLAVPGNGEVGFACSLPIGVLGTGDYRAEVSAWAPRAAHAARVTRMLRADMKVVHPDVVCMNLITGGSCLIYIRVGEDFGWPVRLVNRGDFGYQDVRVSRILPEVGLGWEAARALPPRSEVVVQPLASVPVSFFQNAAAWFDCPSVSSPTPMTLRVEVPGGFVDELTETALVITPRLEARVEDVSHDACTGGPLRFLVAGRSGWSQIPGPIEVRLLAEVPSVGEAREITATLGPGAPAFESLVEIPGPLAVGPGVHQIQLRWLQPGIAPHLSRWAASTGGGTFYVEGASLEAVLATRPSGGGEIGLVRLDNPGQMVGWVDWRLWLGDAQGWRPVDLEGEGEIAGCGSPGLELPFAVPMGLKSGRYALALEASVDGGPARRWRWELDLVGLDAGLDLWTSQEVYRSGQAVEGLGTLTSGPLPIEGGLLNLEVVRLGAGAEAPEWPAFGAGSARTFSTSGKGELSAPRLMWEQAPEAIYGSWPGEQGPALADLDGDGAADLAVLSLDGQVRAYRGRDGQLLWAYPAPDWVSPSVPAIGDLTGDGQLEVAAQLRDRVVVLQGGTGALVWEALLGAAVNPGSPAPLVLLDLDGDGSQEVAHIDHEMEQVCLPPPWSHVCFWLNTPFVQVREGATGVARWDGRALGSTARPTGYTPLASGDVDGDGRDELVLVTQDGMAALGTGGGGGEVRWSTSIPDCAGNPSPVLAQVAPGPGLGVLVACSSWSGGEAFLAVLSGATGEVVRTVGLGLYDAPSTPVSVADLDGDGDLDAVVGVGMTVVAADLADGVLWSRPLEMPLRAGLPIADLDGDGDLDVLVLDGAAWYSLRLLSGRSGAVVWDSADYGLELAGQAHPALGDLDGDGWLEIALVRSDTDTGEGAYVALDSLTTVGPAGGGALVEEVLWSTQRVQDLAGSASLSLNEAIGALGVTGQLWWRGWLTSAQGQRLAEDRYPFWIVDGDLAVSISIAPERARVGGTLEVSGQVRELAGLAADGVELEVRTEDGQLLFQDTFDLTASEVRPYVLSTPAKGMGTHWLVAEARGSSGEVVQAWARYRVLPASMEVVFSGPEVAGEAPFELQAALENRGDLPLALRLAVSGADDARELGLEPGERTEERFTRSIGVDTRFDLQVQGDGTWSGEHLVRFGLAARMRPETKAIYPVDDWVSIPWSLENLGELRHGYGYELRVTTESGALVERFGGRVELEAAGDLDGLDWHHGAIELVLPEGRYRLQHEVEHGEVGEETFEVQAPLGRGAIPMAAVQPAGLVDVPWSIENLSDFIGIFEVQLSIERAGEILSQANQHATLGPAGSGSEVALGLVALWLEPGSYLARLSGPRLEAEVTAGFEVLAERLLAIEFEETGTGCRRTFVARVTNEGFEAFSGYVLARAPGWTWSMPVSVAGQGGSTTVTLEPDLGVLPVGPVDLEVEVLDESGTALASTRRSIQVRGGRCQLSARPDRASAPAGEEALFPFVLSNSGDQRAVCRLELGALEDQGPEVAVRGLDACSEIPVAFSYLLPWDLEAGEIPLPFELSAADGTSTGGERGWVVLDVQGVEIRVTSSLDKCHYLPGESAQLDLLVESLGVPPVGPVVLAIDYPSFSSEELVDLSAGAAALSYEIPEVQEAWERIMISVRMLSGRAVFIDGKRVRASDHGVWVCTDRDVYEAGDTVEVTYGADLPCAFVMRDFSTGFEHAVELEPGDEGSISFQLPASMRQGTHVLEYGCGHLSHMHPYEVRGAWVRFLSLVADRQEVEPGEPLELEAVLESASDFEGWMRCQGLRPDGTSFALEARQVSFRKGYERFLFHGSMDTDQLGRHRLDCAAFLDATEAVFLAQDWTRVGVGGADFLGVTTDKRAYESGEEGAVALAMVFGHATGAELVLELDGLEVLRRTLDLAGHESAEVELTREQIWALGEHRLDGTLTAGGLRSQAVALFVTRDTIPPAIELEGVREGGPQAAPIVPAVTVTDHNPRLHGLELDGMAWTSGLAIWAEGAHRLRVVAEDLAGNRSSREVNFSIDASAPRIVVTGVEDGACYPAPVAPLVLVEDSALAWVEILLNGLPYASGTEVGEGEHLLQVTGEDQAGLRTERSVSFTVDLTDPVVSLLGVTDGLVTEADVQVSAFFVDTHLVLGRAYLDGRTLEGAELVSEEGDHHVQAYALDCAGRVGMASAWFSIDRSPPELVLWFVQDGACYPPPVSPVFWAWDPNLASLEAWLDGEPFESGGAVEAEGSHQLDVAAEDLLGHRSEAAAAFLLDGTPPVVVLEGVQAGAVYSGPVVATFSGVDENLVEVVALLNGEAYLSGTEIATAGAHELAVWASDCAGNTTSEIVRFSLQLEAPLRPVFRFAACAQGNCLLENHAGVEMDGQGRGGSLACQGELRMENHAFIAGDATVGGDVRLRNRSEIGGDLYLAGALTEFHNSTVRGQIIPIQGPLPACGCGFDLDAALARRALENDNARLLADPALASYVQDGTLVVEKNQELTLPGGVYYFRSVRLRNNARLRIASGQEVELFVAGDFRVENNARIENPAEHARNLWVIAGTDSDAGEELILGNHATLGLMLFAPRADVKFVNNVRLLGGLVVRDLWFRNHFRLVGAGEALEPGDCP
jgi:hypothetical protein